MNAEAEWAREFVAAEHAEPEATDTFGPRHRRSPYWRSIDLLSPESPETIALGQLKVAPWIPFHLIIGVRHGSNVRRSSDGIVAYSSSYLDGAASELDVKTGHTVTRSPRTEQEVLRILKLNDLR